MHRQIKIPALFGCLQSTLMAFIYYLRHGFTRGLLEIWIFSFVFGVLGGVVLVFVHSRYVEGIAHNASEEDFRVRQRCRIALLLPYDRVFDLCKEFLNVAGGKIINEDRIAGKIEAKTKFTWRTWGNVITFDVQKICSRITEVEVRSQPVLLTTIIDFGENIDTVKKAAKFLAERDNWNESTMLQSLDQESTRR